MICKYLEGKIELIPEESGKEPVIPMELEYYLVESENMEGDELEGLRVYGVEIVKKAKGNSVERKSVRNLSCSRDGVRLLLHKLIANTVTPVGLPFILDDMLGI
jgi:hypothetical protein